MKHLLILLCLIFSLSLSAQSTKYHGNYEFILEMKDGAVINYTLTLNPNGTFLFRYYRKLTCDTCKEENSYGTGVWKAQKKLIFLSTDKENHINDTYTLNLNNTKARYISKSPRDKSAREIKTGLKFYASEVTWLKGKDLYKTDL
jgi:hypothetical protein